jgi:hypothetical protein
MTDEQRKAAHIHYFLRNYLQDLKYHAHLGGCEQVNGMTCGTPEFESDAELLEYISAIEAIA